MNETPTQISCRSDTDRRQREVGPPPTMADRRMRGERRGYDLSRLSFAEWSEAASNFYYDHSSLRPIERRRVTDRRRSESGPPSACKERRVGVDRRSFHVSNSQIEEWVETMSNYYYHFHYA